MPLSVPELTGRNVAVAAAAVIAMTGAGWGVGKASSGAGKPRSADQPAARVVAEPDGAVEIGTLASRPAVPALRRSVTRRPRPRARDASAAARRCHAATPASRGW